MEERIILGIDPGMANLGYGIVKVIPRTPTKKAIVQVLAYGTITTSSKWPVMKRLRKIYDEMEHLIDMYSPTDTVVERFIGGYKFHNAKTTCTVNQAIGAILASVGKNGALPIEFFSAKEVKKNITGYGSADKTDIQNKVRQILQLEDAPKSDHAADALAFTICYSRKKRWI